MGLRPFPTGRAIGGKRASHYPRTVPKAEDRSTLNCVTLLQYRFNAGARFGMVVEAQGSALGERGSILLCGGRRFGGLSAWTSSEGLCGCSPSRRSLFALLRMAQRGRRNRSPICDTECVGHKVMSSRSSSSVQRDIAASVMEAPSATDRACRFASRLWRSDLFHMEQFSCAVRQMANRLTETRRHRHQLFDVFAAASAARFSAEVTPALPTAASIAIRPSTTSNPSLVATK